MKPLIECVPNVSEGRNSKILDGLQEAIKTVKGVALLDVHTDPDHHRSVLTFAGYPQAVIQAAFQLVNVATTLIDVTAHCGEHPRVGAVDVVPLIPLQETTMAQCVEWAKNLGEKIGSQLQLPVFLYEESCPRPERRRLEVIRRGGLASLASRIKNDPAWVPDFGPQRIHPTAGAVVVGARPILIAFNVVLQSDNIEIARAIARTIRSSSGGLPFLKAIGVRLESRHVVQVSMNLTNYHETSMEAAFEAVQQESHRFGVEIVESELVGLIPRDALDPMKAGSLQLRNWKPDKVLETCLDQSSLT